MSFKQRIDKAAHVEIKNSSVHGRGVFAITPISKGALIENAPAVFFIL
jgi:predicted aldo/keto reductase-like oxidoreductase